MLVNHEMKINRLWFLLVLSLCLVWPLLTQGLALPRVYITAVDFLSEMSAPLSPGDEVSGEIAVWNYEDLILPDLKLRIKLIGSMGLIEVKDLPQSFSLDPQTEVIKNFRYTIPAHSPAEELILRIEIINSRGEDFTWSDQKLTIASLNRFIELSDFYFIQAEENFHPGGGLIYQPLEPLQIAFRIQNNLDQKITAYPVVRLHRRSLGTMIDEKRHPEFNIDPQSSEHYQLSLAGIGQPNSYLTELTLYDYETNLPISNTALYRWVVPGRSANILSIAVDQPYYWRQREALVNLKIIGSADHLTPASSGTVSVSFYDPQDNLVGQSQPEEISLIGTQEINLSVPIEEIVANPKIVATVQSGGVALDEYQVNIHNENYQQPSSPESWWQRYQEELLFIIAILITFLMLGFYFGFGRKKDDEETDETFIVLIIIFLLMMLPVRTTQAIFSVDAGCCETQSRLISPLPPNEQKPTYFLEEEIRFAGSFSGARADNQLFFNKISFYITADQDISFNDCCQRPETECLIETDCLCLSGCRNAYGAQSSYYQLADIRNAKWCDQVKNQSAGDQESFYKLGDIYPDDVPSLHQPYRLEYDESFIIPRDLPFSGPVRFYVVYSGMHWNDHWHWGIAYQKGYIAEGPTVGDTWTEWNYVDAPRQPILAWDYQSQNNHIQAAYQIILSQNANLSKPLIQTEPIESPNQSYGTPANILNWNTRYYWQVRVRDEYGQWSSWSPLNSFTTPLHAYPAVGFDWQPQPIHALMEVQFINRTEVSGGARIVQNTWTFRNRINDEIVLTSNISSPRITFPEKGYLSVTLAVTDSSGYSASQTQNIEILYPLTDPQDRLPTPIY